MLKLLLIVIGGLLALGPISYWHVTDRLANLDLNNPPNMAPQVVYYFVPMFVAQASIVCGLLELIISKMYAPLKIGLWYWLLLGAVASLYFSGNYLIRFAPNIIDPYVTRYIAVLAVLVAYGLTWRKRKV